jgi:hypothetical protein
MKFGYLLALLCLLPAWAQADIYKAVDADGHVTYSSAPLKGGKRVVVSPSAPQAAPERARTSSTPAGFPKVNEETQRGRDDTRHKILNDELNTEEALLVTARQNLQAGEANRSIPRDNDKMKDLNSQVDLHKRNIEALKTELSKLK